MIATSSTCTSLGLTCPLHLQVAANNKGIGLVQDLIEEYGLPTVQAYMHHIQVSHPLPSESASWAETKCWALMIVMRRKVALQPIDSAVVVH